ncbi:MAG TPA: hypothetical protein PKE06_27625 [Flavilitoribacter sp.]|nr:hypothetical protein [Flavilitoribacter sp.]HMQ91356.1 hypothetical protein [Flavilitoribacter sp.]
MSVQQIPGAILLAEKRAQTQTDQYRSRQFFPAGNHAVPAGSLVRFDEDTLAGGAVVIIGAAAGFDTLLIPLVGGVHFKTDQHSHYIEAGSSLLYRAAENAAFSVTNPFQQELVNFLHIRIKGGPSPLQPAGVFVTDFNLEQAPNRLLRVSGSRDLTPWNAWIGKFGGREEAVYRLSQTNPGIFAFAVDGAFEVQNRLVHPRDGLLLWQLDELELEALSDQAVILILEIPL